MSLENIASSGSEVRKTEETKEERKARKAAKKLGTAHASSITTSATSAGPSSLALSSEPSKAQIGVEKPVSDGALSATPVKKEKRKRAKEVVEEQASTSAVVPELPAGGGDDEEEKKRRKREKKEKKAALQDDNSDKPITTPPQASQPPTEPVESDATKSKKEKRIKNPPSEHSLPSIQEITDDTDLSEPAQLALKYVHEHSTSLLQKDQTDGKAWKFQKKRQAWLTRHLWDSEELPDKYVAMVLVYLKTTQGGARASLIELAKTHVKAAAPVEAAAEAESAELKPTADTVAGTDEAVTEVKGDADISEEKKSEAKGEVVDPVVLATRKDRAERLLKVMGAR